MFVQHVEDELLEIVIMIAWCMWYNRNAVRHGSTFQSAQQVIQKAWMLISKFQAANHLVTQWREDLEARWTIPAISSYKVNVDGVVFAQSRQLGIGIVIQDHKGRVTAALRKKFTNLWGWWKPKQKPWR